MKFGPVSPLDAEGAILAHSTHFSGRVLKKGHILNKDDIKLFSEEGFEQITVARLDPSDIPENKAAAIITKILTGQNTKMSGAFTGRCNIISNADGLLLLDEDKLNAINLVHESVTVATAAPFEIVNKGQLIATIKIIPFSIPKSILDLVLKVIADTFVISIACFTNKSIGLIMSRLPGMRESILDKTVDIATKRIEEFNSKVTKEIRCSHAESDVILAIKSLQKSKCDIILIFGASAVVDRADILPAAVTSAGGTVDHFGMPVDPGNLLFIGKIKDVPVVGMPSCARSPKLNGFDWILWRLLCDIPVKSRDIMLMGAGGLLKEISERGQLRQVPSSKQNNAREPLVIGLLLAAGSSKRMGKENKLLANIHGTKMVAHVAKKIKRSKVDDIIVVTGHESENVELVLKKLGIKKFIHNPDHAKGLSTSLRTGLTAAPDDIDGVMIFLGDMPLIQTEHINHLIQAFDPIEGRSICVPIHGRKRGNPVLWSKKYINKIISITGDIGARHLLEKYNEQVIEVAINSDGILFDVDTPESLKELLRRTQPAE